jgi:hypothetical protein
MTASMLDRVRRYQEELTATRHDIHAHPELGLQEHRTLDLVARELQEWGIAASAAPASSACCAPATGRHRSGCGRIWTPCPCRRRPDCPMPARTPAEARNLVADRAEHASARNFGRHGFRRRGGTGFSGPVHADGERPPGDAGLRRRRRRRAGRGCEHRSRQRPEHGVRGFWVHAGTRAGGRIMLGNSGSAAVHNQLYDFNDEAIPNGVGLYASVVEKKLPKAGPDM